MKRYVAILLTGIITCTLSGCGSVSYPDMTKDAVALKMGEFVDPKDHDARYGTIEYEGRTYIGYGTLAKTFAQEDIDQCVGYIVMDENSASATDPNDKSRRVYTFVGDTNHDYLMDRDISTTLMNQPYVWRAIDTQGTDAPTFDYIESLEYAYWN
ncbi:MAG: hypothetical protein IJ055_07795 [Oscillospiraceae bacterium]|nr:hypothetical protein [Oscillospiraceae bacterium]